LKALIQRVKKSSVSVDNKTISTIGKGLLIFIGIYCHDTIDDVFKLCNKILNLRIFNNGDNKINYNVLDIKGEILLISQFTLCSDTKKGNRPSFIKAMNAKDAVNLFDMVVKKINNQVITKTGKFGAMMDISLINDGPMTIMLDTKNDNK